MASFICDKTCQIITRLVFLIFILIMGTYFFWTNEKITKKETFVDPTTLIVQAFSNVYKRNPTADEIQSYNTFVTSKPSITVGELETIILSIDQSESSIPTTTKTMDITSTDPSTGNTTSSGDPSIVITQAFNNIYKRDPTDAEMTKFTPFASKPNITVTEMEDIITSIGQSESDAITIVKTNPESAPDATLKQYIPPQDVSDMVTSAYMDMFNRPPTAEEMQFFSDYASNKPGISRAQLADVISSTAPMLEKNYKQATTQTAGFEVIITDSFNTILYRNPSPLEMSRYLALFQQDTGFSKDKLQFILMASDEYQRLQKTQTNSIYSNLPGQMTDRQLTMIITQMYLNVTGSAVIDEDTMRFLKKRYLEMNMDDNKFKEFLKNYITPTKSTNTSTVSGNTNNTSPWVDSQTNDLVAYPTSQVSSASSNISTPITANISAASISGAVPSQITNFSNKNGQSTNPNNATYNNATIYNIYTVGTNDYMGVPNNVQQISDAAKSFNGSTDTACKISPELANELNNQKATAYSDFINARNMDGMANTCARNKKYRALDDEADFASVFYTKTFTSQDMVLDPSLAWSVPQSRPPVCTKGSCSVNNLYDQSALIGTPIEDAQNTKVGSILPPFPPT